MTYYICLIFKLLEKGGNMKVLLYTLCLNLAVLFAVAQGPEKGLMVPSVREYDFQNTLAEKQMQQPSLIPLDTMGMYVLDTLNEIGNQVRTVYRFRKNAGVQFNNTLAGNFIGQSYSIELYFVFDDLSSWKRVIDWKNRTSDHGAYIYNGQLNFYPYQYSDTAFVSQGQYTYYVLTRDSATQTVKIYTDTKVGINFVDQYGDALLDTSNVLNFFRDDLVVPNEASSGAISMLNIYNYALDSAQIQANFANLQGEIFSVHNLKNEDNIKVFPNPASDYLVIDLKSLKIQETVNVSLLSMIGEDVYTNQYPSGQQINLDLNSISCGSGIYMIRAETSSGTYMKKVVISR